MELTWIGCPNNWRHAISPTDYTCMDCGCESVEYDKDEQDRIRLIDELTKPE